MEIRTEKNDIFELCMLCSPCLEFDVSISSMEMRFFLKNNIKLKLIKPYYPTQSILPRFKVLIFIILTRLHFFGSENCIIIAYGKSYILERKR